MVRGTVQLMGVDFKRVHIQVLSSSSWTEESS